MLLFVVGLCGAVGQAADDEQVAAGKQLFLREWKANDPLSPNGDGLGPMHNDTSCVACHKMGGIGGAGPIDKNVDVLALKPPETSSEAAQLNRNVASLHAGFFGPSGLQSNIILHRLSTEPRYSALRSIFLGEDIVSLWDDPRKYLVAMRDSPVNEHLVNGVRFQHVQRNSSAMFGNGLLDRVKAATMRGIAKEQQRVGRVSGRPAPLGQRLDRVGRFGWRGQTKSLRDFVTGACAAELGLHSRADSQLTDPFDPAPRSDRFHDLDEAQVQALVAFCASLPAPIQVIPADPVEAAEVKRGEQLFSQVMCGECHRRNIGPAKNAYTDLLLHDMGQQMSDPVGPELPASFYQSIPAEILTKRPSRVSYYGRSITFRTTVIDNAKARARIQRAT
ncbi:MAG: di-heme oxidoredictase family protein [Pirellulaceae bacterium]|nr:di-heme oxidoredictase family protein [Pirellulaceae bacterium]